VVSIFIDYYVVVYCDVIQIYIIFIFLSYCNDNTLAILGCIIFVSCVVQVLSYV